MTMRSFRIAALAAGLAACEGTDTLLEAVDPDLINPPDTRSAEGAQAIYFGALNRLRQITGGTGGEGSSWLFGGLLADEWSTSSTFVQNDETDQRNIQINNSTVTGMYRDLARTRTSANQAIALLREFRPDETSRIAEMYFVRGFAEMQLASDFCNGLALSDGAGEEIIYGPQLTIADVFTIAEASFDSAIALVPGTSATEVSLNRAARIGKARALLGLGSSAQRIAAGQLVANIPTSYTYSVTFTTTSGDVTLWAQPASARRYSVGDSVEGNARNIRVANAIPFHSAGDPRVPSRYTVSANGRDTTRSQDGLTFSRTTTLWGRSTPVPVVNGIDARMIEAEGLLEDGNPAGWLAIHNALRAAPPALGAITPAVMPALVDPGTAAGRIDLHFREKAFWTFSRGHRLGDMRRLIRQYSRTADQVFPTGIHFRGGNYGSDVNLPVPQAEQNNPNVGPDNPTCTDRDA
jgi:hypothetical protein